MAFAPSQSQSSSLWESRATLTTKTYSTSSRSTSYTSNVPSVYSSSRPSAAGHEDQARIYYDELKQAIVNILAKEAKEGPNQQRVNARLKLGRLNTLQFHELAMDVYDEQGRRYYPEKSGPFLPVRDDFHPRRNQARQKLATLPVPRFQDLVSDHSSPSPLSPPSPLPAQPSKSTNIVPVKGMISVEPADPSDDESSRPNTGSGNFQSLDSLMADLDNMVGLQKSDSGMYDQLDKNYKRLEEDYNRLEREYNSQQEAVRQVKKDTQRLITDLKSLSSKTAILDQEKLQLEQQLRIAKEEAKMWQTKYENTNQEINYLKGISPTSETFKNDIRKENFLQPTREGIISQDSIMSYQTAINELLETARSSKPSGVLITMKTIIMISKRISENVEAFETSPQFSTTMAPRLHELKVSFSTTLTQLLASAKGHAMGMGMSPVSLLDASAGHLTAVIVEMTKFLGLTSQKDGIHSIGATAGATAGAGVSASTSSAAISKTDYLKEETDHIVQAIQSLLAALRSPNQINQVQKIIQSIDAIVSNIIRMARNAFSAGPGLALAAQGDPVLSEMAISKSKLLQLSSSAFAHSPEKASAAAKRDLAKEAYEIAKYIKELISIVEKVIG
ncbi:hypothetical protein J3Q64DRAFT_1630293 [Phycomyces blakesleeanus]|uniref:GIT Spa2 homology (SHD) domain-containing protein n=1 Tax=Phycomyces blakesleeanus TaxID=4837 RepID=A0ABR3BE86_PHYBL